MIFPQPTLAELEAFYSPTTGYHTVYSDAFIASQRKSFANRIAIAQELIGPSAISGQVSVFDIGAANGLFLDEAKKQGWQTYGIEMNPETAAYCVTQGHQVTHSSVDMYTFTNSYTVIHMGDVIEHMLDPVTAVRKCAAALVSGGLMIIATPNTDGFFQKISLAIARTFSLDWPHALPPAHTFQFSTKNLDQLMAQYGLTPKKYYYYHTSFMEEMRDTTYFQTIYSFVKKKQGSLFRFIGHTILFGISGLIYLPLWIIGYLHFRITGIGSHVTVWYQKQ
jgi:SAM-dependent methyltransferase